MSMSYDCVIEYPVLPEHNGEFLNSLRRLPDMPCFAVDVTRTELEGAVEEECDKAFRSLERLMAENKPSLSGHPSI